MLNGPEHCLNTQGSIFVIAFDRSEKKSAQKTIF